MRRRALDMMLNITDISPSSSELQPRDDANDDVNAESEGYDSSEPRGDVSTMSQTSDPDGWIERHY